MLSQEKRLQAVSNNLANVSTAGFKREDVLFGTFGEHIAVRMNAYNMGPLNQIGGGVFMQTTESRFTDFEQGGPDVTDRAFDMAIIGDGFFVIDTPEGPRLTRDGQFALDEEGYLVLPGFGRVQGEGGDINLEGRSDFIVSENGNIMLPDDEGQFEVLTQLSIALVEDTAALDREPSKLWYAPDGFETIGEAPANTMILQRHVERSNVNVTQEMTRMIAAQRSLQSAAQLVRMFDEMSQQGATRISSVN